MNPRKVKPEEAPQIQHPAFQHLDNIDLQELCDIIAEPVRSIHQCISKGQLRVLCKQLLAENLALQKRVQNLEKLVQALK